MKHPKDMTDLERGEAIGEAKAFAAVWLVRRDIALGKIKRSDMSPEFFQRLADDCQETIRRLHAKEDLMAGRYSLAPINGDEL